MKAKTEKWHFPTEREQNARHKRIRPYAQECFKAVQFFEKLADQAIDIVARRHGLDRRQRLELFVRFCEKNGGYPDTPEQAFPCLDYDDLGMLRYAGDMLKAAEKEFCRIGVHTFGDK